jgi:hypothetical protein
MLYVKSNTRRGGYAQNLFLDSIRADNLHGGWAFAQMDYNAQTGDYVPVFSDWNISHVTGDSDPWVFNLHGLAASPIQRLDVSHSAFTNIANPIDQYGNVKEVKFTDVTINGLPATM